MDASAEIVSYQGVDWEAVRDWLAATYPIRSEATDLELARLACHYAMSLVNEPRNLSTEVANRVAAYVMPLLVRHNKPLPGPLPMLRQQADMARTYKAERILEMTVSLLGQLVYQAERAERATEAERQQDRFFNQWWNTAENVLWYICLTRPEGAGYTKKTFYFQRAVSLVADATAEGEDDER